MNVARVRGMQDFLPERARKKKFIEELCRKVFEKYGFMPMETPIVEELALLTAKGSSGEEIEKEIYSFEDKSGRKLGLRFDLTVPLARVIATNREIALPFKRYQIGRVYRYDRPQAKRYREFTQADIDIVGSESILSELELIAIAVEIMQKLKIDFYITINSRALLEELALACSVKKSKVSECFRLLDKSEKIGWRQVMNEFKKSKISTEIISFVKENSLEKAREKIRSMKGNIGVVEEVVEFFNLLKELGLEKYVKLDLSLARGLAYYTGLVFEVKCSNGPSIGGGGRYDKLVELFNAKKTPAVGISFGVERLLDVAEDKMQLCKETRVFIVPIGSALSEALKLAQKMRAMGINTEIDLMKRSISKNLEYVNKKGIPFAVILGEKELKEKKFTLKEMNSGKQEELKFSEIEKLKELVKD